VFGVEPGQKEEMAKMAGLAQLFAQSVLSATNSFSAHGV
jgi:hypothetical protein